MEIKPDILLRVRFFTTEEGGRWYPIWVRRYSCPFIFDIDKYNEEIAKKQIIHANDGFLIPESGGLILGLTYNVKVKFLIIENVKHLLYVGKRIYPWDSKIVAEGEIIKVF